VVHEAELVNKYLILEVGAVRNGIGTSLEDLSQRVSKPITYKQLWWVLSNWFFSFGQKTVFWIPGKKYVDTFANIKTRGKIENLSKSMALLFLCVRVSGFVIW
jgi:hypothetical protein